MGVALSHGTALSCLRAWDIISGNQAAPLCPGFLAGPSAGRHSDAANAQDWRSPSADQTRALFATHVPTGPDAAPAALFSSPLNVLVSSPARRSRLANVRAHVWRTPLPPGSFVEIQGGLFACSPELCYLQCASSLELAALALLGCELQGCYTPRPSSPCGVAPREPLMTPASARRFLDRCEHVGGLAKAREALGYALPGAASPMEGRLALFFTLPRRYGGKQLPRPALNMRFDITGVARRVTDKSFFRGDLCWKEAGVAVEYDSDAAHTGSDRIAADTKRRNALACMGVTVIGVTRQQACDFDELNRVALVVGKLLGVNQRERRADQAERCRQLHEQLFRSVRPTRRT